MQFMPHTIMQTATIVIPMEDPIIHTEAHPMCFDGACPCRQDQENLELLADCIRVGVLTEQEVDVIMQGATI